MRISNRYVIPLILGLALVGTSAAQASASQAPRSSSRHTHTVVTAAPTIVSPHTSHASAALSGSTWSGYEASSSTPNTYDDVTATWVVPTVTCTNHGIVLFFIGLDGWNSSTVERTGVGADCTSGSPQYFYDFFTGIELSSSPAAKRTSAVQNFPVKPGDSITAEVLFDYQNTQYDLSLSSSEGWTAYNTAAAPLGYQNSSAEIIAEAASNGTTAALPSFAPAHFTYATINGATLPQSSAQPIDMINSAGTVIATTGPYDSTGENFTVTYTGP